MKKLGNEVLLGVMVDLLKRSCITISSDAMKLLKDAHDRESSLAAKGILETMIENVELAKKRNKPVCQSPGFPTIYVTLGREIKVADLQPIFEEAIKQATNEYYLRPSMVHPLTRKNTGDNSGIRLPNIELEYKSNIDYLEIIVSFKGCGAELGNAMKIFTPAQIGKNGQGIKRFTLETVAKAGGKPCPPIALGIGIGGQMDVAAKLSRRAVSVREWDDRNPVPELAQMEEELLILVNELGIGAGGVGGDTTALAVKIEMSYTHTAICPVAINFHCWAARKAGVRIHPDGTKGYLFEGSNLDE